MLVEAKPTLSARVTTDPPYSSFSAPDQSDRASICLTASSKHNTNVSLSPSHPCLLAFIVEAAEHPLDESVMDSDSRSVHHPIVASSARRLPRPKPEIVAWVSYIAVVDAL